MHVRDTYNNIKHRFIGMFDGWLSAGTSGRGSSDVAPGPRKRASVEPNVLAAFHYGVKRISDSIASIERSYSGPRNAVQMMQAPNATTDEREFYALTAAMLCTYGNCYWHINHKKNVLTIRYPDKLNQTIVKEEGIEYYKFNNAVTGNADWIHSVDILHFKRTTLDGYFGDDPRKLHGRELDRTQDLLDYIGKYFRNSAMPSGVLKLGQQNATNQQMKAIHDSFLDALNNERSLGILAIKSNEDFTPVNTNPATLQLVQNEDAAIRNIARMLGTPPSIVGETSRNTYSNAETEAFAFVNQTIKPMMDRIKGELKLKLDITLEYDVSSLLAGDRKSEMQNDVMLVNNNLMKREAFAEKWNLELPPEPTEKDDVSNQTFE